MRSTSSFSDDYHSRQYETQMHILSHQSLVDLIVYLNETLETHYPMVNLPQLPILKLILTSTTTTPYNCENDVSKSIMPFSRIRPVNCLAREYLENLLELVAAPSDDPSEIRTTELDSLRTTLTELFSFLIRTDQIHSPKRKRIRSVGYGSSGYGSVGNETTWLTRTEFFGNTNFDLRHRGPEEYILWPWKCAIEGLTHGNQNYRATWYTWHGVLSLIFSFYAMELHTDDIESTIFHHNVLLLGRGDAEAGALELIRLCMIKDIDSLQELQPIMENDLVCLPNVELDLLDPQEAGSELGLDSIPLRQGLILVCRQYIEISKPRAVSRFIKSTVEALSELNELDRSHFDVLLQW